MGIRCQIGSQCSITRQLAPESLLNNEYVDIIVVVILLLIGTSIGVIIPKLWANIQSKFFSSTTVARDRFIQLSTIDDDEDDDGFI